MRQNYSKLRLTKTAKGLYYISFYCGSNRYRYSDGKCLGLDIRPNRSELSVRQELASELLLAFRNALEEGWSPIVSETELSQIERFKRFSPEPHLSDKYKKALQTTKESFLEHIYSSSAKDFVKATPELIEAYLKTSFRTPSSFNHERVRLHVIFNSIGLEGETNPVHKIKKKREKQELHKPFSNVTEVLEDIRKFNANLHLCCLLTYGCLLRPHQEIRNLKWSDFSEDLSYISMSGKRNKSGRNRIVPVQDAIKRYLSRGDEKSNIFTGKEEPYGESYFKVLWKRYKEKSKLILENQTLYSFRHSGAIKVFEKTQDLVKLQYVMGHSDLKVTLTYLRGLEIAELKEEDMPILHYRLYATKRS